ncbi:MAG: HDOD domain-containing protein [Epsilonproteobacteria bacterium]|nr:HDOD domain-containing protein [Campylobacterota bacterium]
MEIFGLVLGKKRKQCEDENRCSCGFVKLERREHNRYLVEGLKTSLGEAVEVSLDTIAIEPAEGKFEIGNFLEFTIEDEQFEGEVIRVQSNLVVFKLTSTIPYDLIKNRIKKVEDSPFDLGDVCIKRELVNSDEDLEKNRAVVNLMLELDDPNTNIEKFIHNIEALPKLTQMILEKANSIEVARGAKVTNLSAAVARLGFEEVKRIVYEYINFDVNLANKSLPNFKDFEAYYLLLNAVFRKLAKVANFKDIRSEGQSLLSMSTMGAVLLAREDEKLSSYYDSISNLFGFEMRVLERNRYCTDIIDINRLYFFETLRVFTSLFDGFAMANLLLYPSYSLQFDITTGDRKFRYAYISYLAILALKFILDRDKYSGYIFYNRMRKFGYGIGDTKELLEALIAEVKQKLNKLGISYQPSSLDIPSPNISLKSYLGGNNIYYEYFMEKIKQFDEEATRLAIRYEDEQYAHFVLEKVLNAYEFGFKHLPFIIVPCENIADEHLTLEQFRAFDIVIFKNIHKLPRELYDDFRKIWRDFEGKIIATYDNNAMIDFETPELFKMLIKFNVDFPSYFKNPIIYNNMLNHSIKGINSFLGFPRCDLENFKEDSFLSQRKVYTTCIKKV